MQSGDGFGGFGAQFVADAAQGGDAGQPESLYLELRRGNDTLDPADWFVMNSLAGPVAGPIDGAGQD